MRRSIETVFKEDVQKVFDQFSACFNIRIVFYSPTGEMPRVGLNQPDSLYCRLVQEHLYGESACLALDEEKRQEAAAIGEMVCYTCHAGLVEAIKPIYFENKLLGFVAIGQFRCEHEIPDAVLLDWRRHNKIQDLHAAYHDLPYVAQERIEDILGLFSVLVDYIVSHRMISLRGNLDLQEMIAYMENNADRDISLSEVADLVDKSPSTVSHLFKRELGKSFKNALVEIKLRKAEECMSTIPGITIQEAAGMAGYANPLYFSRIYRKYRGFPPSVFKQKAQQNSPPHSTDGGR